MLTKKQIEQFLDDMENYGCQDGHWTLQKRVMREVLQMALNGLEAGTRPEESKEIDLLRRLAKANVIFPSMCANNMEAWNLCEELKAYSRVPQERSE